MGIATLALCPAHQVSDGHLSEAAIAAFIDARLSPDETAQVQAHLAHCESCREEYVAAEQLVRSTPTRISRLNWWPVGVVAAAAAVMLAVALPRGTVPTDGVVAAERQASTESAPVLQPVLPELGSTVDLSRVVFAWRAGDYASYRVTVLDSSGGAVWSTSTSDTTVTLPAEIQLAAGSNYYWYVDALRSDGVSATSGPVGFRTPDR